MATRKSSPRSRWRHTLPFKSLKLCQRRPARSRHRFPLGPRHRTWRGPPRAPRRVDARSRAGVTCWPRSERSRSASELDGALGEVVGVLDDLLHHRVEELVERDEARPFDVPVRLLGLEREVEGVGELLVEKLDHPCAHLLGQVVLGIPGETHFCGSCSSGCSVVCCWETLSAAIWAVYDSNPRSFFARKEN